VSPLQGIWEHGDVKNTRIDFPTPIGLVRKDIEKLLYLTTVLGFLKNTIRRENGAIPVEVAGRFARRQMAVCEGL
jgi:hypothetical protein